MLKLLPALLLTACATAPAHLTQAKQSVDSRMEYVNYTGWVKPSWVGEDQGNCAAFSLAYASELRRMGYSVGLSSLCRTPDGEGHAVLDVDGWRLDNRYGYVMPVEQSDCK